MIYFLIIYGQIKNQYDVKEIIVVLYYNSITCNLKRWFIFKLYWKFMKCSLFCEYLQKGEIYLNLLDILFVFNKVTSPRKVFLTKMRNLTLKPENHLNLYLAPVFSYINDMPISFRKPYLIGQKVDTDFGIETSSVIYLYSLKPLLYLG